MQNAGDKLSISKAQCRVLAKLLGVEILCDSANLRDETITLRVINGHQCFRPGTALATRYLNRKTWDQVWEDLQTVGTGSEAPSGYSLYDWMLHQERLSRNDPTFSFESKGEVKLLAPIIRPTEETLRNLFTPPQTDLIDAKPPQLP